MENSGKEHKDKYRTTIRMRKEQFEKVSKLALDQRKSVPRIFLELLGCSVPSKVLMSTDNTLKVKAELNRIGNNVNQIARKVNTGEVVLSQSFDDFRDILKLIYNLLGRTNGLR